MALRRDQRRRILRVGQILVLSSGLILLAAWNSGISLLYLMFSGLASFLFVAFISTKQTIKRLEIKRDAPATVNRDEPFAVLIDVHNPRRFLPSIGVKLECPDDPASQGAYIIALPAGRTARLRMSHQFARRGVYPLPHVQLVSTFPFNLFEARRRVVDHTEVVVYPRVVPARTSVLSEARSEGVISRTLLGDGDEFFSLREYVPGDEPRNIAWRASARTGTLMVREKERRTSRQIVFVLDSRYRPDNPDWDVNFEEVIETIASLAVTVLNRQYLVSVITPTLTLEEGEGPSHANRVLNLLARLTPAPGDAPDPIDSDILAEAYHAASILHLTPNPFDWGQRLPGGRRYLDPREVIHA